MEPPNGGKRGELPTSEYRDDRLMHSLNLLLLEYIARKEGDGQKHNKDEESPRGELLPLPSFGSLRYREVRIVGSREHRAAAGTERKGSSNI